MSSARAVRAMVCANHSLQTCFSQKELFIEYGIFNLFKCYLVLNDLSKLSLSFKINKSIGKKYKLSHIDIDEYCF